MTLMPSLAFSNRLPSAKDVTVLIYYSGNNRLSDFMHSSYLRVLREGAGANVNVVVQFAGSQARNSFRVAVEASKIGNDYVQTFYEKHVDYDMGDSKTLARFVAWGKKSFPAKRTILIISAHGFGILNNPFPDGTFDVHSNARSNKKGMKPSARLTDKLAFSIDEAHHTFMTEENMVRDLKLVLGNEKLDLLVQNSCLMGSLESLTILSSIAKFGVASEYSIYMNTNDDLVSNEARTILLENIIHQLKENSQISERDLGKNIVQDFEMNYKNFQAPSDTQDEIRFPSTLAFYDLTKINLLALQYSKLAAIFQKQSNQDPSVFKRFFDENLKARYVDSFGYIDLYTLYKSLVISLFPTAIDENMKPFEELMNQVILEKTALFTFQPEPSAHLHVFFPSILTQADLRPFRKSYSQIKSVQQFGWPQFLDYFWNGYEQQRDTYWLSKLESWSHGDTIIIKPTSDPSSYDYDLFLELSMMAIRMSRTPGQVELKKYGADLDLLQRESSDLKDHRVFIKNLIK